MTFDSIFVMRPLLGSISPPRSIWLIYLDGRSQFPPLLPFLLYRRRVFGLGGEPYKSRFLSSNRWFHQQCIDFSIFDDKTRDMSVFSLWSYFWNFTGHLLRRSFFTRFFFCGARVIFPARVNGATYYVLNDGGGKNKQAQKRNPVA